MSQVPDHLSAHATMDSIVRASSPDPNFIHHVSDQNLWPDGFLGLNTMSSQSIESDDQDPSSNTNQTAAYQGNKDGNDEVEKLATKSLSSASPGDGKMFKKAKKPKIAFQTRSHVDILDDGYRWRKYGQKAVKNSRFARSYYKCTYQGCSVKKQVQRLSSDEGVVVTTYEGLHTHSTDTPPDNFNQILTQMKIFPSTSSHS